MTPVPQARITAAWAVLTAAFAAHVLDEAAHDFLGTYNPAARAIRARLGLPFPPVFSFRGWLLGLGAAVAALAALTPAVRRGRRWVVPSAYAYGGVHMLNGLGHVAASVARRRLAPGVLSAPTLLLAAGWLLVEAERARRAGRPRATTR